jgi:Uncharacterised protein family (UPF0259)
MLKRLYPPLRPQSVSEVLDTGYHIFAASVFRTLPYGILLILAGQLVNIYNLATGRPLRSHPDAVSLLLSLVGFVAVGALWGALMLHQRAIAQGQRGSMRAELARVLHMLPQLMGLVIVVTVVVVLGLVLLVVPGFYLLVALSLATPLLVFEGRGPINALNLSRHLMRGHWWRTAGIYTITLVVTIVFYFLGAILVVVAVQLIHGADVALTTAAARVLIIALGAFSFPYTTATQLAVLGDLQVRAAAAAVADGGAEN